MVQLWFNAVAIKWVEENQSQGSSYSAITLIQLKWRVTEGMGQKAFHEMP